MLSRRNLPNRQRSRCKCSPSCSDLAQHQYVFSPPLFKNSFPFVHHVTSVFVRVFCHSMFLFYFVLSSSFTEVSTRKRRTADVLRWLFLFTTQKPIAPCLGSFDQKKSNLFKLVQKLRLFSQFVEFATQSYSCPLRYGRVQGFLLYSIHHALPGSISGLSLLFCRAKHNIPSTSPVEKAFSKKSDMRRDLWSRKWSQALWSVRKLRLHLCTV